MHPMCPVLTDRGMFAFIVPGPKLVDLARDGRYALHSFPCVDNEDAFYATGRAESRADTGLRDALAQQFFDERKMPSAPPGFDDQQLFELLIEACMVTRSTGHGDPFPRHTIWRPGD